MTDVRLAISVVLRLRPQSLVLLAPVCSTMGTLARAHTKRCFILPLGDETREDVSASNLMTLRPEYVIQMAGFLGCTSAAGTSMRTLHTWLRFRVSCYEALTYHFSTLQGDHPVLAAFQPGPQLDSRAACRGRVSTSSVVAFSLQVHCYLLPSRAVDEAF